MAYKDIMQLRKEGRLEEALQMARADISQSRNLWTCRALFWCLYDSAKNTSGDELSQLVVEMQDLVTDLGDDEVVKSIMDKLSRCLIPHFETVHQAAEEAKSSDNALKSYRTVSDIFSRGELDSRLYSEFGWIIYHALHADKSDNVTYRKEMLARYLKLKLETPSLLHSLILGEAVKVEKTWPEQFMFTTFVSMWDLDNLRDDDWQRFVTDSRRTLPSTVEKMIYLYTKEVRAVNGVVPSEKFLQVLDKAIEKWGKDENLLRCKAMLCEKRGQIDEAIVLYKKILTINSQKQYLWSELANLVDDIDVKKGLLCKALMSNINEEFIGKIRMHLAEILIGQNLYANALFELNKIKQTYESHGWNLSPEFQSLASQIPSNVSEENNTRRYMSWAACCNQFLYSEYDSDIMVKLAERTELKKVPGKQDKRVTSWQLIDKNGKTQNIRPRKFALSKAPNGTCFEVKLSGNDIVHMSPSSADGIDWVKNVSGTLRKKTNKDGKDFGFVSDCYVHGKLIRGVQDGETICGVAIRRSDKWQLVIADKVINAQ